MQEEQTHHNNLINKGVPHTLSSEERFEKLITEVEDYAILLLDTKGNVLSWNKGAEKIKGYSSEEIVGKNFRIFYPNEDNSTGLPSLMLTEAVENGKANHEGWRVRKDGSRFWGSINLTSIHDPAGNVTGFLKLTRDQTDKKSAEDKLGNFIEELRQKKNGELKKSEDKYHKMLSEVQDYAIILLDIDGKILDWNKGAEKLKGYRPVEIIGKSFRLFYANEDKDAQLPERLLNEARQKGKVNHEGYRIRKDGTRFWGNVAITAIHDDNGGVVGFSKVTKDLTERKMADDRMAIFTQELQQKNEALRRSQEQYNRMIAEVQDYAIFLLDKNGFIQNWNAGAEFIKGYVGREAIGKSFRIFYTPEDIEKNLPAILLSEAEKMGKATNEGWRLRKDGSRFWGSIVITALHDSTGNVIGFSKVTRDLTEKKKADDILKQNAMDLEVKNHELEKLNAELSSFVYVVSHDLKEPIRKIQMFAGRQLEEHQSAENIKHYAQKIITAAARMQELMTALLSYSEIAEVKEKEAVNLNDTLAAVRSDLEIVITESNAVIQSAVLPTIPGIGYQLNQLFLNLLSNAIKFSNPKISPRITISVEEDAPKELPEPLILKNRKYVVITFSDNGVGFDPHQSTRIFEVFQRLKPNEAVNGTGIGLSIVKKVVEAHDGYIEAESIPGNGSTFRVYLPS